MSAFRTSKIGYEGEREVDRHLGRVYFPEAVQVLTNVELQISSGNFIQIDTLILTTNQVFVLEIKNIAGTLKFLQNPPRLQRTLDTGEVHIFSCPEDQLEKNMFDLELWLARNGLPLKTSGAIILAYSKTNVKTPPLRMPIFYATQLPQVLRNKKSNPDIMSSEQLHQIAHEIRSSQKPFNPFPLCTHFRIDPQILATGMYCNLCHSRLIKKTNRTWICQSCGTINKNPYSDNVKDWFTLVQDTITNKECRRFLNLKDKYAAHYVLNQLELRKTGKNRSTKYHWPTPLQ
ncbi:nuclease-related domain-containing protein [Sporosarcina sp. G11-34]|uniref:nuclease-related domain-containing protein n=1 Tax=Sporosarcina sp. G11-34 TaxID=2849605 RepID=UPI0022A8F27B|nr:nuclease-related domain-containing protein [Sporosarcina sp. G11-34]MCZ2257566.1 NERD domain-containing protein [Sporosarcina sp. G11-34]